jgi:hypothetical protein
MTYYARDVESGMGCCALSGTNVNDFCKPPHYGTDDTDIGIWLSGVANPNVFCRLKKTVRKFKN